MCMSASVHLCMCGNMHVCICACVHVIASMNQKKYATGSTSCRCHCVQRRQSIVVTGFDIRVRLKQQSNNLNNCENRKTGAIIAHACIATHSKSRTHSLVTPPHTSILNTVHISKTTRQTNRQTGRERERKSTRTCLRHTPSHLHSH